MRHRCGDEDKKPRLALAALCPSLRAIASMRTTSFTRLQEKERQQSAGETGRNRIVLLREKVL